MDFIIQYLSGWTTLALICLLVGIALLIIEMFMPGFGICGGLGIAALVAAIVLRADTFANAMVTLAIVLLVSLICGIFFFRSFGKGALSKSPIVLNDAIASESNELSTQQMQELVGHEGVCINPLRPAGNADFNGLKLDVVSSGEFIKQGSHVRIEKIDGLRILVKELPKESI